MRCGEREGAQIRERGETFYGTYSEKQKAA